MVQHKINKLPPHVKNDVYAFFDGITLISDYYMEFGIFLGGGHNERLMFELIMPQTLENTSSDSPAIARMAKVSGVYDTVDMTKFFTTLQKHFRNLKHPVSLAIRDMSHTINIGYDPTMNAWFLGDSNQLPILPTYDGKYIAQHILAAFRSKDGSVIYRTAFYYPESDREALTERLNKLTCDADWQRIHKVTPGKAQYTDKSNASWLMYASINGEVKTVEALIKNGADVEKKDKNGCDALKHAVSYSQPQTAAYLHQYAQKNVARYVTKTGLRKTLFASGIAGFSGAAALGAGLLVFGLICGICPPLGIILGGLAMVAIAAGVAGCIGYRVYANTDRQIELEEMTKPIERLGSIPYVTTKEVARGESPKPPKPVICLAPPKHSSGLFQRAPDPSAPKDAADMPLHDKRFLG